MNYLAPSVMLKQPRRRGTHRMIEHGSISRAHVYDMLRSKEIRVRRAAFTLLEASNPRPHSLWRLFNSFGMPIQVMTCIRSSVNVTFSFVVIRCMNLSLRVSNEKGGHKKVPLPFSVASKMSGSLRQDSSRDCLGSVLADVGPVLLSGSRTGE